MYGREKKREHNDIQCASSSGLENREILSKSQNAVLRIKYDNVDITTFNFSHTLRQNKTKSS